MKTQIRTGELSQLKKEIEIVMSFPIPGDAKLFLNELYESVILKEAEVIAEKTNLIKHLGKVVDGDICIDEFILAEDGNQIPNPGFAIYHEKVNSIESMMIDIEHAMFYPVILRDVRSEYRFSILYRFFNREFFI